MSDTSSPSPDPVPPDLPDPLHGLGPDQLVPVLVESFGGMFDIVYCLRNIYGNGKINVRLLVNCLLKLFISLSVFLALSLLIMALNTIKNHLLFLPGFVSTYFPTVNITTVVQTLLPLLI